MNRHSYKQATLAAITADGAVHDIRRAFAAVKKVTEMSCVARIDRGAFRLPAALSSLAEPIVGGLAP